MKLNSLLFACGMLLICPVLAQSQSVMPQEFIESTSPLPGGGVVTSVYYPNQQDSTNTPAALSLAAARLAQHRVLNQSVTAARPIQTNAGAGTVYPSAANLVPVSQVQVPALGVPTRWNTALRPICRSCKPATGTMVPVTLSGIAPPAATLPPVLPQASAPPTTITMSPSRTNFTPMVRVQNMPPNVYAGQGIIGSPKLYVDGQPVRNLLRYLIVP